MIARHHDFLCIFDDENRILILKQERHKVWLKQVTDKIVLNEDELAVDELADQVFDVSGLSGSGLTMQKDDARLLLAHEGRNGFIHFDKVIVVKLGNVDGFKIVRADLFHTKHAILMHEDFELWFLGCAELRA